MAMTFRFHFSAISIFVGSVMLCTTGLGAEVSSTSKDQFSGFPEIGKHRPGIRSQEVINSDVVKGVIRPKWTRAMGDLGGWTRMFRMKKNIILFYPHCDGHRGKKYEATGKVIRLLSKDEGKTWQRLPASDNVPEEVIVVGDTAYGYSFPGHIQTTVQTSQDGIHWSEPKKVYKSPFWLYGVIYDKTSKQFWAAAHAIDKVVKYTRQIHLVKSADGFDWQHVSTVHYNQRESESILRFEDDRTMVILIRKKYADGRMCWMAVGNPPYKKWDITERPVMMEGEHFFDIGGQTFVGSRALYQGDDPRITANDSSFLKGRFSIIYKWTPDRQFKPWAVMDSMGDCSYPHLVETPTEILCAYYSQHEDKVCKPYLCAYDKAEFLAGPAMCPLPHLKPSNGKSTNCD
ncbi:MAG: hypothetical protein JXM70_23435 [Pirellulales bacterium]|nr:hypothetical protein [Pirellulales bacterium]